MVFPHYKTILATNLNTFYFHVDVMKQDPDIPYLFGDALFCDRAVANLTVR